MDMIDGGEQIDLSLAMETTRLRRRTENGREIPEGITEQIIHQKKRDRRISVRVGVCDVMHAQTKRSMQVG